MFSQRLHRNSRKLFFSTFKLRIKNEKHILFRKNKLHQIKCTSMYLVWRQTNNFCAFMFFSRFKVKVKEYVPYSFCHLNYLHDLKTSWRAKLWLDRLWSLDETRGRTLFGALKNNTGVSTWRTCIPLNRLLGNKCSHSNLHERIAAVKSQP